LRAAGDEQGAGEEEVDLRETRVEAFERPASRRPRSVRRATPLLVSRASARSDKESWFSRRRRSASAAVSASSSANARAVARRLPATAPNTSRTAFVRSETGLGVKRIWLTNKATPPPTRPSNSRPPPDSGLCVATTMIAATPAWMRGRELKTKNAVVSMATAAARITCSGPTPNNRTSSSVGLPGSRLRRRPPRPGRLAMRPCVRVLGQTVGSEQR
jgi:hypothetical protein